MQRSSSYLRAALAAALLLTGSVLMAIQTQEVDLGVAGVYDGAVMIARDGSGRLTFRDSEVTSATTLASLLASHFNYIEQFGTLGAAGTAPVADGAGGLAMIDIATQTELDAKADRSTSIGAGAGLAGGGDLSSDRSLAFDYSATLAGDPAMNGGESRFGAAGLLFEGATANASEGLLTAADPTADRTWTLPDASGTFAVGAASPLALSAAGALSLGTVGPANGGTGTATAFTAGSVVFAGSGGAYAQDNSNLFWDASNHRLGIRTASPTDDILLRVSSFGTGMSFQHYSTSAIIGTLQRDPALGGLRVGLDNDAGTLNTLIRGAGISYFNAGNVGVGTASPARKLEALDASNPQLRLTQADGSKYADLRVDASGVLTATPSGSLMSVAGDLNADGALLRRGQRVVNGGNLLDNPDFNIWQRNTTASAASGGDSGGTLTYPVPGTLTLGADRWQASRAKTDMTATISRATPPSGLATAQYAMKLEATAGAPCRFYVHQTLTRERTLGLRGKWLTFAASVYETGTGGGNIAIYKTVGGAPTELARYAFSSTANGWDRVAVAAQIPADAETVLVSIEPELSAAGTTTAYLANMTLAEGKYVASSERVTDPATSSLPPLPRDPAGDLASCQRYFEKGELYFTCFAPDSGTYSYVDSVHYNTAKAAASTLTISDLSAGSLTSPSTATAEQPAYSAGTTWPQGFRFSISGNNASGVPFGIQGDWTAECAEPI